MLVLRLGCVQKSQHAQLPDRDLGDACEQAGLV